MTRRLTKARMRALISAASAMLAGEEGEGDAEGVSFKDLRAGQEILQDMLEARVRKSILLDSARERALVRAAIGKRTSDS